MASAQDIAPPLTLEELVTIFRQEVDDLPGDTVTDVNWKNDDTGLLWKNQEAVRFANRAQNEFCYRQPILDSNSVVGQAITHITVAANVQRYTFSERILAVLDCKFVEDTTGDEHRLKMRTAHWMNQFIPQWDLEANAATKGDPQFSIHDYDLRSMDLYPIPEVGGVLHMKVHRLPTKTMSWSRRHLDEPEIEARHHWELVDFMVYLAYQKRDAETENPELATAALERFTVNVGERPSARLLRVRRQERGAVRRARAQYF